MLLKRGIEKVVERDTDCCARVLFYQPPRQILDSNPKDYVTKVVARLKNSNDQEMNIVVGEIQDGVYVSS